MSQGGQSQERVRDYGLQDMCGFSQITDEELDDIVKSCMEHHRTTSGQTYITGYIKSLGYRVQRSRVRECLVKLEPQNTT